MLPVVTSGFEAILRFEQSLDQGISGAHNLNGFSNQLVALTTELPLS